MANAAIVETHTLEVRLLGRPEIVSPGGVPTRPRGNKSWALLAYLLLSERPIHRTQLAELLFADAGDPLSALRWNLAELRRALGSQIRLGGDPVSIDLPAGTRVDAWQLASAAGAVALSVAVQAGDLLGQLDFHSSAAFEIWLMAERRRLAGTAAAVIREGAHARLAVGDALAAVALARVLVDRDPLDEESQELLVRALVAAGDESGARRQQDEATARIRSELGVEPGPGLRSALARVNSLVAGGPGVHALTEALLNAGQAAMAAGASDVALRSLRDAQAAATAAGDPRLRAKTLVALGGALVHGLRGLDGEAAAYLHEAVAVSRETGQGPVLAHALRELGYIEMLRGRYDRADRWLAEAAVAAASFVPSTEEDASSAATELAWARAVRGAALGDRGLHEQAFAELQAALELARRHALPEVEGWALTFQGRSRLLIGDLAAAASDLADALTAARRANWASFIPLPAALLGEVRLADGEAEEAERHFETAFALALQFDDPCWEGISGRGLGLVAADRGDLATAFARLAEARRRCIRVPDAWLWVEAYCLEALAALAVEAGDAEARRWIEELEALASRTGMRELVVRALRHRGTLGDADARIAAGLLAEQIENPVLTAPA